MKAALLRLFLAAALLFPFVPGVLAQETSGKVLWVYDGDTIKVAGIGKVRLLGIDAPEREDSQRDRYLQQQGVSIAALRRVSAEARLFTIAAAKGKTVALEFDREKTDRHGRTLAYVILPDGRTLNRLLLEQGLAVVYRRFDFARKKEFLAAEATARGAGRGLWGNR